MIDYVQDAQDDILRAAKAFSNGLILFEELEAKIISSLTTLNQIVENEQDNVAELLRGEDN